jgi:hypothetical protein
MTSRIYALPLLVALLVGTGAALADEPPIVKTTPAGQAVKVRDHAPAFSGGGCSGIPPTITFDPKPAHGTVDIRPDKFVFGKGYVSGATKACEGQMVDGIAIWYTPAAGFKGVDQFGWTADFGGKSSRRRVDTHSAQITVQ